MIVSDRIWTEDRLIEAMCDFMERTGRPPRIKDFNDRVENGLPAYITFRRIVPGEDYNNYCCRLFGLKNAETYFSEYIRSVGGPVVHIRVPNIVRENATHLEPVYLARWIAKNVGNVIGGGYLIKSGYGGRPKVYRAEWVNDAEECPPKKIQNVRAMNFTKADVVDALKKFNDDNGRLPTVTDTLAKNRGESGLPCYDVIRNRFEGKRYDEIMNEVFGTKRFEDAITDYLRGATSLGVNVVRFHPRDIALMCDGINTAPFAKWLIERCTSSKDGFTIGNGTYAIKISDRSRRHVTRSTTFVAEVVNENRPVTLIESVI